MGARRPVIRVVVTALVATGALAASVPVAAQARPRPARASAAVAFPEPPAHPVGGWPCVAARVDPFACGTWRPLFATGSLAVMNLSAEQLTFGPGPDGPEAHFFGGCNAVAVLLAVDGRSAVPTGTAATTKICDGIAGALDAAVYREVRAPAQIVVHPGSVVVTAPSGSAVFTRG